MKDMREKVFQLLVSAHDTGRLRQALERRSADHEVWSCCSTPSEVVHVEEIAWDLVDNIVHEQVAIVEGDWSGEKELDN